MDKKKQSKSPPSPQPTTSPTHNVSHPSSPNAHTDLSLTKSTSPQVREETRESRAAMFHSRQAMEFLRTQQYEQANVSFRKAFQLYSHLRDYVRVGCVVHQLGVSYREQGNLQGALAMIKKASDIFLKVKPTPRYDCLANAVFDINLCFSKVKKYNQSQAYLESTRRYVPYFPLDDQAKFFYNLSLAQLKQGLCVPATLGFGLAVSLLQAHIQRESLTEQCPRGLVHLLANAHLNQAEALTQLVADYRGSYAMAQKALKVAAVKHERTEAKIYFIARQRGRSTGQGAQQVQGSINNVGSHVSHVTKGTVVAPLNHQEKMRSLMPPPPPRTPNRQRIKDKMQGTGRTECDVKREKYGIPARMRAGQGHPSTHKARRVRSQPEGLRIDIRHTAKRNQQSKVAPLPVNDRKQAQLLRDHIELVYRKALELHLKAARSGSASTSDSNLELAAYSIQQLVCLFHTTGQGAKSQSLLQQCQSLTCLTSNPRYQPHFLKWFRKLQTVNTPS